MRDYLGYDLLSFVCFVFMPWCLATAFLFSSTKFFRLSLCLTPVFRHFVCRGKLVLYLQKPYTRSFPFYMNIMESEQQAVFLLLYQHEYF